MTENLPLGAAHDSSAPYNQEEPQATFGEAREELFAKAFEIMASTVVREGTSRYDQDGDIERTSLFLAEYYQDLLEALDWSKDTVEYELRNDEQFNDAIHNYLKWMDECFVNDTVDLYDFI